LTTLNARRATVERIVHAWRTPMAQSATVAVYEMHEQADAAMKALQRSGFDLRKLSIIGKDFARRSTPSATTTPEIA
jgi:hypothetical protein